MITNLMDLWSLIPFRFKNLSIILVLSSFFVSFLDVISIGLIIPFVTFLLDPDAVSTFQISLPFFSSISFVEYTNSSFLFLVIFLSSIFLSYLFRFIHLIFKTRLIHSIGLELAKIIYSRYLHKDYITHTQLNSSDILSIITTKVNLLINRGILPLLSLFSSIIMSSIIFIFLFYLNPFISTIVFSFFFTIYLLIVVFVSPHIRSDGAVLSKLTNLIYKKLTESSGVIRDVLLTNTQNIYLSDFTSLEKKRRNVIANLTIYSQSPRLFIEMTALIFILCLAFIFSGNSEDSDFFLAYLGALAFSSQRLLPLLQSIYSSIALIQSSSAILSEVNYWLSSNVTDNYIHSIPHQHDFSNALPITFSNVSFNYNSSHKVFNNVSFTIKPSTFTAIIGKSGSGKSTLLDLIMGLLVPSGGVIKYGKTVIDHDSIAYLRDQIVHVPQSIYLLDDSIKQNIALHDYDQLDIDRVIYAAKMAHIHEEIISDLGGYDALIGDKGIRISGGQRQRLALARAFYQQGSIFILDEATNALDSETEEKILNSIHENFKGSIVIIVTHKESTLTRFDQVLIVDSGSITCKIN